jgi:hypothetical protein
MPFTLAPDANIDGTHLQDSIMVAPQALVAAFGEPGESDGYKVSGEYVFRSDEGEVFTLYDWKMTTLYDGENTLRPSDLWDLESPIQFNIGGNTGAGEFKEWLQFQLARGSR